MKLGYMLGLLGRAAAARRARRARRSRTARLRLVLDRGGVRLRRADAARVVGRGDDRGSSSGPRSASCRRARRPRWRWPRSRSTTSRAGASCSGSVRPGPQVAEGWYGDDYRKPLARTREYVEIVRQVLAREAPVEFHGERYELPRPGGLRQAAEVDHAPVAGRPADLPRRRGTEERRARRGDRRRLAADVLRAARRRLLPRRAGRGLRPAGCPAHARTTSRSRASCRSSSRPTSRPRPTCTGPMLALYIGGMGAREVNFHNNVFARMGYEGDAKLIQDLYLDGKKDEAAAAVPTQPRRGRRARRPAREDPRRPRRCGGSRTSPR